MDDVFLALMIAVVLVVPPWVGVFGYGGSILCEARGSQRGRGFMAGCLGGPFGWAFIYYFTSAAGRATVDVGTGAVEISGDQIGDLAAYLTRGGQRPESRPDEARVPQSERSDF